MNPEIIITDDGTPTLYRSDIDEHYHSVKGALTEGLHVYVNCGWRSVIQTVKDKVRVFEVGFGSGLNAALTAREAERNHIPTIYFSVELFPLPADITAVMTARYDEEIRRSLTAVNKAEWGDVVEINPFFRLQKIRGDLLSIDIPSDIDVIYFDAFAPEKQPEMWGEEIFRKLHSVLNPRGILTTYCAKGAIRRMLERIGFSCERLPGPPGGKREILRAHVN